MNILTSSVEGSLFHHFESLCACWSSSLLSVAKTQCFCLIIQHPAIWAFHFQIVTLSCFIWSWNRWKSWIIYCFIFTNETAQNKWSVHENFILRGRNSRWLQIFFLVVIDDEGSKGIKLLITAAAIFIARRHSHNTICRTTAFFYTILFLTTILKKNASIDIWTIISWI